MREQPPAHLRDDLIARIMAAFDGVLRGEGITWHEAEEIDCYGDATERAAARLIDNERCWQDVPDNWIEEFPSAPTFLDSAGFRYYLPVIMVWSLRRAWESDSATADNLLWLLGDPERQNWCERDLSPVQMKVVADFVDYMVQWYWRNLSADKSPLLSFWRSEGEK